MLYDTACPGLQIAAAVGCLYQPRTLVLIKLWFWTALYLMVRFTAPANNVSVAEKHCCLTQSHKALVLVAGPLGCCSRKGVIAEALLVLNDKIWQTSTSGCYSQAQRAALSRQLTGPHGLSQRPGACPQVLGHALQPSMGTSISYT